MKRPARTTLITHRLAELSEPTRLRLLRLLEREELSVGELAKVVQLPQSTVSRHLKILSEGAGAGAGGWLVRRSEGTATLYHLVLDDLPTDARALWLTVRDQMGESPELAEDLRRLQGVLAERRLDSQAFFGRVAGQWDEVRRELFGDRATLQAMLSLIPRSWTVADLGCGTGNAAEILAPLVERVIAVDQSAPMLKAAKKRLEGASNVTFLRGDLENLPLEDASVDAAVCVLVLHHIAEPGLVIGQMARILRPGGVALVVDMLEHDRVSYKHTMGHRWLGFGEGAMTGYFRDAGLEAVRFLPLPADPGGRGPGLFSCTAYRGSQR